MYTDMLSTDTRVTHTHTPKFSAAPNRLTRNVHFYVFIEMVQLMFFNSAKNMYIHIKYTFAMAINVTREDSLEKYCLRIFCLSKASF